MEIALKHEKASPTPVSANGSATLRHRLNLLHTEGPRKLGYFIDGSQPSLHNELAGNQRVPINSSKDETDMEMRKETLPIMMVFGENLSGQDALVVEQIKQLLNALSAEGITVWTSHPVAAMAHGVANAVNNPVADVDPAAACLDYLNDTAPAPIHTAWQAPFLEATRSTSAQYFENALLQFARGNYLSATEDLCSAVSCSVIGHAAVRGWPHANTDDDLNAVFGLALGQLPQDDQPLYQQLECLSDTGHALNSNYAATMGMPDAVRQKYFQENGYTPSMAMFFAKNAIDLADQLGTPEP